MVNVRRAFGRRILAAGCLAMGGMLAAPVQSAKACGGLFCNQSQPVNQAAERILFVDNGDDTTTAVIEIQYEGPSERFAWVLPVTAIENPDTDIRVSSVIAFDRLQQVTNPNYILNTTIEGTCMDQFAGGPVPGAPPPIALDGGGATNGDSSVVVEASGSVGPFDYELLQVIAGGTDPAEVAIQWLADNMYDLGDLGADVLRPYLAEDMRLLAVRLTKGNNAGSIRPLSIRYSGSKPSIPIRPTAVAANPDMGIMVWVAGDYRAVPMNYKDLVLNDALINWYNASSNYNEVVIAAADESGGQGFVTEYAQDATMLDQTVFYQWEMDQFTYFSQSAANQTGADLYYNASSYFGAWDGFNDAFRQSVTITGSVTIDDVMACPTCYLEPTGTQAQLDANAFRTAIYELVVRPMSDFQSLLISRPYVTRLYTTMSADEMTVDPLFDFNADLASVSNVHTADLIIECSDTYYQFEAPFRVELPSGLVVHGTQQGTWPVSYDADDMPASLIIAQASTSGDPKITLDNASLIQASLDSTAPPSSTGGSTNTAGSTTAGTITAGTTGGSGGSMSTGGTSSSKAGGGNAHLCSFASSRESKPWAWMIPALAVPWRLRRQRRL